MPQPADLSRARNSTQSHHAVSLRRSRKGATCSWAPRKRLAATTTCSKPPRKSGACFAALVRPGSTGWKCRSSPASGPVCKSPRRNPAQRQAGGFGQLMQKLLAQEYAPASALINRTFEVLCLQGATSNYLDFPSGEPSKDLLTLARPGLPMKIRAAVARALREGQAVTDETARVEAQRRTRSLRHQRQAAAECQGRRRPVAGDVSGPRPRPSRRRTADRPRAIQAEEQSSVVKLLEDELTALARRPADHDRRAGRGRTRISRLRRKSSCR